MYNNLQLNKYTPKSNMLRESQWAGTPNEMLDECPRRIRIKGLTSAYVFMMNRSIWGNC